MKCFNGTLILPFAMVKILSLIVCCSGCILTLGGFYCFKVIGVSQCHSCDAKNKFI